MLWKATKYTLNRGHLSIKDTICCPMYTGLCTQLHVPYCDTSLYIRGQTYWRQWCLLEAHCTQWQWTTLFQQLQCVNRITALYIALIVCRDRTMLHACGSPGHARDQEIIMQAQLCVSLVFVSTDASGGDSWLGW